MIKKPDTPEVANAVIAKKTIARFHSLIKALGILNKLLKKLKLKSINSKPIINKDSATPKGMAEKICSEIFLIFFAPSFKFS